MLSPLPPPSETHFQDNFTHHWEQCERQINRTPPLDTSVETVFYHAKELLILVANEQPLYGAEYNTEAFGPLLSTLIQDKFLDKLLLWVEGHSGPLDSERRKSRDFQRMCLLDLFEYLITQSRQPVLNEITVLRPLLQFLYKLSSQVKPAYAYAYARTIHSMCVLLCRSKSFFDSCKKTCDELFGLPYMLISLLVPLVHRSDKVGNCTKDAALLVLSLSREDGPLANYLAYQSDFCPVVAASLSGLYSSLPKKLIPRPFCSGTNAKDQVIIRSSAVLSSDEPCLIELPVGGPNWHQLSDKECKQSDDLRHFLNTLEFCDLVVKVSHKCVQKQLMHYIHSGFLILVLGSALHQTALNEVVAATAYLELFLRRITSDQMIRLFLKFILTGTHDSTSILMSLITRLKANAEVVTDVMHQLGMVTLSLFRTLLNFHSEDVMYELVLKHLMRLHHLTQSPPEPRLNGSRPNSLFTQIYDFSRGRLCADQLSVNLLRSGDRFMSLAINSTLTEDLSASSSTLSHPTETGCSSSDPKERTLPSHSANRSASGQSYASCIASKPPDFHQYVLCAGQRIEASRVACRLWKSRYDLPRDREMCRHLDLSDNEIATFENRNLAELHASPFAISDQSPSCTLYSLDSPGDTAAENHASINQPLDFATMYQLNYINDFSDEDVQPSELVNTDHLSTPGNLEKQNASHTVDKAVCDSRKPLVCTCHVAVTEELPAVDSDEDCSLHCPNIAHFKAFLRVLDTVHLQWECPLHFGQFPTLCSVPPLDAHFLAYLDEDIPSTPNNTCDSSVTKSSIAEETEPPSSTMADSLSHRAQTPSSTTSSKRPIIAGGIGPFLSVLLDRLKNLDRNCLFTNLLLTELFTILASYPCPLLFAFLLDSCGTHLKGNVNSLFKVLHSVRSQISASAASVEHWPTLISRGRVYLNRHLSLPSLVVDPDFYSPKNRMRCSKEDTFAGRISQTSTPNSAHSSKTSPQTISPLQPVTYDHITKSSPRPIRSDPLNRTIWHRAASVIPLQRSVIRSRKSTESLNRQQHTHRRQSSTIHSNSSSDSDCNESPETAKISTRIRNLVFSALIFDEFCYELAGLCYSHSMLSTDPQHLNKGNIR